MRFRNHSATIPQPKFRKQPQPSANPQKSYVKTSASLFFRKLTATIRKLSVKTSATIPPLSTIEVCGRADRPATSSTGGAA